MKYIYIFDCDGVLLDTNELKINAFIKVLSKNNFSEEVISKFVSYSNGSSGVSRYVKFRILYKEILKCDYDEALIETMLSEFSKECIKLYRGAVFTPGAVHTVEQLSLENILYIASGSDQDELNFVLEQRKISNYFTKIFGSPSSKSKIIKKIIDMHSADDKFIMIGDAEEDYKSALENGVEFIYMEQYSLSNERMQTLYKSNNDFKRIKNLKDLI